MTEVASQMLELRAKVIDEICSVSFGPRLSALGFAETGRRFWVRERMPAVKDVFELRKMKGATLSPRWGFSLDFVPHVRSRRVCWHRTPETAMFDVIDDPIDTHPEGRVALGVCWLEKPLPFRRSCLDAAKRSIPLARTFWGRVQKPDDLLVVLEFLKSRPTHRFGMDNYPQEQLAYAMVLAMRGQHERARAQLLASYLWQDGDARVRAKLEAALHEASGIVSD